MARIEPSLYEPADDARIFDGAETAEDEGSRLPLLIVVALLVLAAFAGVVWLAYSQGVARGQAGSPRILAAASGPIKVAPANPGGAPSPYRGLKIYQQPAPQDDGSDQASDSSQESPKMVVAAKNASNPEGKPKSQPQANSGVPTRSANTVAIPNPSLRTGAPDNHLGAATPQAVPATALVKKKAQKAAPTPASPLRGTAPAVKVAENSKASAVLKPADTTGVTPVKPHEAIAAAATNEPSKPAADASNAQAVSAGGNYLLQIGSFKSEAEATSSWERFKTKHEALVGAYGPNIQSVNLGAKGTWYRLRMGGFSDRSIAADLCVKLRAAGASCIISR